MGIQVNFNLEDNLNIKLDRYCKENNLSKANAINKLLKEVLKWKK